MIKKRIHLFSMLMLMSVLTLGQISPGDLSQSHAELEGMSNCILCHDIGDKVSNKKCLDCHDEIKALINANQGYHANNTISKKDCFDCHSDHHGRKFDMTRFDEANFKHSLTGYQLEGKHDVIDCRNCHVSDFISDPKIKKRTNTFLGLQNDCISCHEDFHQKTLSSDDCLSCHDMEAFNPAPRFDHNQADFILKEKHQELDCLACHEKTVKNGKKFQKFNSIPFNDCNTCHEDPHSDQLPGKCMQCHTESSFLTLNARDHFNHQLTSFELKGKHSAIACFTCHTNTQDPLMVFQDQKSINENNCVQCHTDQHQGKYGLDCAQCHSENSFIALKKMDFFNHDVTDYHLQGKHQGVDCRKCHTKRFSTPIEFTSCTSCHDDYHRGEFEQSGVSPDCIACHSLDKGFGYSLFTLEQHQETSYPLEGAHMATPCFACHVSDEEERWTFKGIDKECINCHDDVHSGSLNETFFEGNPYTCTVCHTNDTWSFVNFDHDQTDWSLSGKHQEVDCRQCHFEDLQNASDKSFNFVDLDEQCASCHENIHEEKFAVDGITDCNRCHVTSSWFPEKFDHNSTAFPLDGKHAEIACEECHRVQDEAGLSITVYKLGKLECIDCH